MGEVVIEGRRLDVKEGLDFSFNYSIADVRDPNKRSTEYSKTISCPGTPSNDELFGNIWDVNISNAYDSTDTNIDANFNPNKKAEARVIADGVEVMTGVVQLRGITILNGKIDYEVVFIGNLINIFEKMGDKGLNDFQLIDGVREYYIDFSDLNHTFNYTNIADSWDYNEGYVYPMVDCGESTESDAYGRRLWHSSDFRPWLKVKTIVDRIFAFAGFTYTSSFFDSNLFDRLITSEIKETVLSFNELQERNAEAEISTTLGLAYDIFDNLTQEPWGAHNKLEFDTVVYDVGSNWQTATYLYQAQNELIANITSSVEYRLRRVRQSYYSYAPNSLAVYRYDIQTNGNCDVYDNGTGLLINSNESTAQTPAALTGDPNANVNGLGLPTDSNISVIISILLTDETVRDDFVSDGDQFFVGWDLMYGTKQPYFTQKIKGNNSIFGGFTSAEEQFLFNAQVDISTSTQLYSYVTSEEQQIYTGDQFWSEVFINANILDGVVALSFDSLEAEYKMYPQGTIEVLAQNSGLIEWQNMDMNAITPDVKMSDFLMSIFKMFNLYVTVDRNNESNLLIETRDDFYAGGTTRDWNKKLARDKKVKLDPLGRLTAKEFIYTYTEDEDYYNSRYQENIGNVYGTRNLEVDNDFLNNTREVEVVFSPTPLVNDDPSNRIIPKIYDSDIEEGAKPTEGNIRILYYAGLITSTPGWIFKHLPAPPLNVLGGAITTLVDSYPYAGHLDNPLTPTLDLNFGIPQQLFYTANVYTGTLQYTNANLFNVYHRNYLNEITDKDSKVLKGEFYLTPWDIAKLDFRDQILVDNSYWRINKINDYNPFKNTLTKVELIKVLDVFKQPNEVFNLGGSGSVGSVLSPEKYPRTGNKLKRNASFLDPTKGTARGRYNRISNNVDSYKVLGNRNFIGEGSKNVTILGSDNYVGARLENVVIINSNNQSVYNSNTTIIDGKVYYNWTHVDATANYTTSDREVVSCDASTGAFTVTLPTKEADTWVSIKKTDSSANAITITTPDATNIDGAISITLTTRYEAVDLYCSDKVWLIR